MIDEELLKSLSTVQGFVKPHILRRLAQPLARAGAASWVASR